MSTRTHHRSYSAVLTSPRGILMGCQSSLPGVDFFFFHLALNQVSDSHLRFPRDPARSTDHYHNSTETCKPPRPNTVQRVEHTALRVTSHYSCFQLKERTVCQCIRCCYRCIPASSSLSAPGEAPCTAAGCKHRCSCRSFKQPRRRRRRR